MPVALPRGRSATTIATRRFAQVSTTDIEQLRETPTTVGRPVPPRVEPTPGRHRRQVDLHRGLVLLAPALLYVVVREIGLLVLTWLANSDHTTVTGALTSWDGQWYLGLAAGGYNHLPAGLVDAYGHRTADTPLAFFPGYPALVRWVAYLPGVNVVSSAFTVSLASGVFAAYALARIGRRAHSARTGLVLVVLFAASPMGIVLSMAYSEATFCALAAWALVGVVERRWLLAGLCAAAAGLFRPTAAALVVVVLAAAVVAVVRRQDGWRPWVGGLLAPVGLVGYLAWVAVRTGSPTGYFAIQKQGWDSTFDGGVATVKFGLQVLASGRSVLEVGTVAILVVAIVLLVVAIRDKFPWPLWLYGLLVLAMDLGSNGLMNSKARLLLPAFTLLLPAAVALANRRRSTMLVVLAGVAVASAWFGGYAITGWMYAI
jgi:hypothetical protein